MNKKVIFMPGNGGSSLHCDNCFSNVKKDLQDEESIVIAEEFPDRGAFIFLKQLQEIF